MRVLLDTVVIVHALLSPERLPQRVKSILEDTENILELSSISVVEIAIKTSLGKLTLSADAVRQHVKQLDVRLTPYRSEYAFELFHLPWHHRDPFDRQLIAQAISENIPVITSDERFRAYKGVKIIW